MCVRVCVCVCVFWLTEKKRRKEKRGKRKAKYLFSASNVLISSAMTLEVGFFLICLPLLSFLYFSFRCQGAPHVTLSVCHTSTVMIVSGRLCYNWCNMNTVISICITSCHSVTRPHTKVQMKVDQKESRLNLFLFFLFFSSFLILKFKVYMKAWAQLRIE